MERLARIERTTLTFGGLRSYPTELQAHIKTLITICYLARQTGYLIQFHHYRSIDLVHSWTYL